MTALDILIIDDDMVDREAVKRYLKNPARQINFHEAQMGEEGLALLRSRPYDCVFLDYLLPDMDGIGFLKKIYDPELDLAPAPVVMLTGQGNEAIMLDALRRGAQDYLIKNHITSDTLNIAITKSREIYELKKSRKQAEDQLYQMHKLEAVGQLTSGVAHDFNNLLTVVMGNTRILLKRLKGEKDAFSMEDAAAKVEAIEVAARMGAELVSHLMVFTRQKPLSAQSTDINKCINEAFELLKRALGEKIETHIVLTEDPWPVSIDIAQFGSALINIGINARDAMPDGGKLTIETSNIVLDETYTQMRPDVTAGPYIMVAISDTGSGMSNEIIKRVFEPFFTTKPIGEGTGLGLSMVYGFINQSGGHINVYSEIGHGSVFKIYLPRLHDEHESLPPELEAIHTGKETILVAEDDAEIRQVVTAMLERFGYKVIPAENGRIALEILKRNQNKIDLIFTDVVMPGGMNGIDLVREARTYNPKMKALYTSGYTENAFPNYQIGPGEDILSKPYQKSVLAKKIRAILDMEGDSNENPHTGH